MEKLSDRDIDRILSGSIAPADPRLGSLSAFTEVMRETFATAPSNEVSQRHLAAMGEAFVPGPAWRKAPRRRRKLVAAAAAALTVVGASAALAATGNLGPLQDGVANVADNVGLEIPGGQDALPPGHAEDKATERAQTNRETAKSYVDAKTAWTACVAEAAPQHEGEEAFDPEAACGPKPNVKDFKPENTPPTQPQGGPPADEPSGDGGTGAEHGQGQGGPPAEHPGQGQGGPPAE